MSDASQGPGWWQASDEKWYPPELHPNHLPPPPSPPPPAPPHVVAYGYPPPAYSAGPRTNGLAVASFVCSLAALFLGFTAVLGIVFGLVARSQIQRSRGQQTGSGLAVAGIAIGSVFVVFWLLLIVAAIAISHSNLGS